MLLIFFFLVVPIIGQFPLEREGTERGLTLIVPMTRGA